MEQDFATDNQLRQYLLGQLGEIERSRVEEGYFTDDRGFEQLLVVEDELIDAYVDGELTAAESARFEHVFLSTAVRRDRVEFARRLRTVADRAAADGAARTASAQVSWLRGVAAWVRLATAPQWAMAAAAVVLLVGVSWLTLERERLQDVNAGLQRETSDLTRQTGDLQLQLEGARRRADALAAERPPAPEGKGEPPSGTTSAGRAPLIASFFLAPRLVRGGGEANAIRIPRGTALLRLQLELDADSHLRYRPVMTTATGEEIWRQRAVPAESTAAGPVVTFELPASLLSNRDYILTLNGEGADGRSEEVAAYSFRVSRQ